MKVLIWCRLIHLQTI